jgi:hypothetical protein
MSDSKNLSSEENQTKKSAALTITIQSWATPIVAVVMLVLGLAAGYYARPYLTGQAKLPTESAAQAEPTSAPASATAGPTVDPAEVAARQAALMQSIVEKTRHFKGNPDAAVTLIEFSDFQ